MSLTGDNVSNAHSRKVKNQICSLLDASKNWTKGEGNIENIMLDYFSNIFKCQPGGNEATKLFKVVGQQLDDEMFSTLNTGFTDEKVSSRLPSPCKGAPARRPFSPLTYSSCVQKASRLCSPSLIVMREFRRSPFTVALRRSITSCFVNDCLLFTKADVDNCLHIAKVLKTYEEASGVDRVDKHEKYLGLPTLVGRNKQGWKGKLLSSTSCEFLVKVITQAIPLYTMHCFLLPKSFCDDLNRMVTAFWWNGVDDSKKIC
ncbi:hypothetical protein EV1_000564 [Malus domestica]